MKCLCNRESHVLDDYPAQGRNDQKLKKGELGHFRRGIIQLINTV